MLVGESIDHKRTSEAIEPASQRIRQEQASQTLPRAVLVNKDGNPKLALQVVRLRVDNHYIGVVRDSKGQCIHAKDTTKSLASSAVSMLLDGDLRCYRSLLLSQLIGYSE